MEQHTSNRDYILIYLRVNGCYFWFNVAQIMATLSMLSLLFLESFYYVTLIELTITLMVLADLLMRYFSEGFKNFVQNWDNKIHLMILALLVISITSDMVAPELTHHDGGIMAGVFLFIRYSVQISRLCRLLIDSKKQLQLAHHQTVNLNDQIEEEANQTVK